MLYYKYYNNLYSLSLYFSSLLLYSYKPSALKAQY
jgi:hypothetical protein